MSKAIEQSDSHVDVTDTVVCYENGKVVECECGHGIGVDLNEKSIKCANCGRVLVDAEYDDREPPGDDDDEGQSSLGDFL